MERDQWASDGPVSAPKADDRLLSSVSVNLGGMIFTPNGIALPVTTVLHDQRYTPAWAPQMEGHGGSTSG